MNEKARFVIIGSGWRSLYFVRIAKALPERFELCAMLCRTQEKADLIAREHGIHTTTSEEECESYKPDFVVVAVTKAQGSTVATHWMDKGFCVLLETPAALTMEKLNDMWERQSKGQKIVVCEQYCKYPAYSSLIKVAQSAILGERSCLNISLAHEYHGFSLMRELLGISNNESFTIRARTYEFPTTETLTRHERITDGRVSAKKRTVATIEFENSKVALYDFDSEQYRSPIRKNTLRLQGSRGEIVDNRVYYLDQCNEAKEATLEMKTRTVETASQNPNLRFVTEVTDIEFNGESLYSPHFGECSLAQDETAMAIIMEGTAAYARGLSQSPYPLEKALQDAYFMLLLQEACETGCEIHSQKQNWNK